MKIRGNSFKAVLGSLAVPMMFFALSGQARAQEAPGHIQIDSAADLQIDQSGNPEPSDAFDLEATFTNIDSNFPEGCDGDDPVAQGLTITLGTGSCGSSTGVVSVVIPPFSSTEDTGVASKKHGGHKKHKNHFKLKMPVTVTNPSDGQTANATLDASITVLPTPAGTCGQWTVDAEVSNVDLSALTANPVVVSIGQGDDSGCNDQIQAQFDNNDDQGENDDGQGGNGDSGDGNSQGD